MSLTCGPLFPPTSVASNQPYAREAFALFCGDSPEREKVPPDLSPSWISLLALFAFGSPKLCLRLRNDLIALCKPVRRIVQSSKKLTAPADRWRWRSVSYFFDVSRSRSERTRRQANGVASRIRGPQSCSPPPRRTRVSRQLHPRRLRKSPYRCCRCRLARPLVNKRAPLVTPRSFTTLSGWSPSATPVAAVI